MTILILIAAAIAVLAWALFAGTPPDRRLPP